MYNNLLPKKHIVNQQYQDFLDRFQGYSIMWRRLDRILKIERILGLSWRRYIDKI